MSQLGRECNRYYLGPNAFLARLALVVGFSFFFFFQYVHLQKTPWLVDVKVFTISCVILWKEKSHLHRVHPLLSGFECISCKTGVGWGTCRFLLYVQLVFSENAMACGLKSLHSRLCNFVERKGPVRQSALLPWGLNAFDLVRLSRSMSRSYSWHLPSAESVLCFFPPPHWVHKSPLLCTVTAHFLPGTHKLASVNYPVRRSCFS